jgi:alkanesulfonate monooxygenase SsuD/methylene tetrahydromethanopterin reductase-like flavin-dependent oxidoreductase (luciferase family)
MHSALFLPIFQALSDPLEVARLAAEAEEHGWDGVFVWDHLIYSPPVTDVADPWITMAAIAAATERVRLGPMVTPLPRRRPAKLVKETVTLDQLSRGRLTLGVGLASDNHRELSSTGEELNDRVRAQQLDESLDILRAAWTGDPVHHRGEHYRVEDITFRPVPVQRPAIPIWVAVRHGNPKPLRRAARHDGVFPVNVDHPDQLAEIVATIAGLRAQGVAAPQGVAASETFDVAMMGAAGADPAPYAKAGATWWLVAFDWRSPSVDQVRGVLREGPPT